MGSYTPDRYGLPRGLDEVGLRLGLPRLPAENNTDYRRRLLLQPRRPPGPDWDSIFRSIARTVGEFDKRVLKIVFDTDSDGATVAADPNIIVSSTRLYVYSDFTSLTLAATLDIWDSDGSYFLKDVYDSLSALSFLTVTQEDDYSDYLLSRNLMISHAEGHVYRELLRTSACNRLQNGLLRTISFDNYNAFSSQKDLKADISDDGDFYVDMVNGVVFSQSAQRGGAYYSYVKNPFYLWWQPIRTEPANDPTLMHALMDSRIDQSDGSSEPSVLNGYGTDIVNRISSTHPLGWGE
jgi:hypothetical protein